MLHRAINAYRDAVARDSRFALAWADLGTEYALLFTNSIPTPAVADSADKATARALALQPDLPEAHAARSNYYSFVRNDHARALEEAKAGLAHGPNARLLSAAVNAEESLGQWDAATAYATQAYQLDPRAPTVLSRRALIAMFRRDTAGARMWADRALAIVPGNLRYIEDRVMVELQRGDLAAARRQMQTPAALADRAAVVAYLAEFFDLGWTLDSAQEKLLLGLGVEAFDGDSSALGIVRAEQYHLRGDQANTRIAAEIAVATFAAQLKVSPSDPQRHLLRGVSLALLGRISGGHSGRRSCDRDTSRPISRMLSMPRISTICWPAST